MIKENEKYPPAFHLIAKRIENYYGVSHDDLLRQRRGVSNVVLARHFTLFFLCKYTHPMFTLNKIGAFLDKGHDSVIYSRDKIQECIDIYGQYKNDYTLLDKIIRHKLRKFYKTDDLGN